MNGCRWMSALVSVAAMALALPSPGVLAQTPPEVAAPSPNVGDAWKFRRVDLHTNVEQTSFQNELTDLSPDRMTFRGSFVPVFQLGRDLTPCRRLSPEEPEICSGRLPFPLVVGKRWSIEKLPFASGGGYYQFDCEAQATEAVTVPAGTFDSLRVLCKGFYNIRRSGVNPMTGLAEETLWYSPQVSHFVKMKYRDWTQSSGRVILNNNTQTELIEFIPKKL